MNDLETKREINFRNKEIRRQQTEIKKLRKKLEEEPFVGWCEFCNKRFENLKSLRNHERSHKIWTGLIRKNLVNKKQGE